MGYWVEYWAVQPDDEVELSIPFMGYVPEYDAIREVFDDFQFPLWDTITALLL